MPPNVNSSIKEGAESGSRVYENKAVPTSIAFPQPPLQDTAPFANNVYANTITQIGRQAINPLSAYDINGQITTYTLTSVPNSGTLHVGTAGAALTAGSVLTAAQASQLYYIPPTRLDCVLILLCGNVVNEGSYSFTYTAKDNSGITTNTATYTIPVGSSNTPNPPIAASMAVNPIANSAAATPITGLKATGGTIEGYRILASSLPAPSQGVMYVGTKLFTSYFQINGYYNLTVAEASDLRFDPAPTFAGLVSFQYDARNSPTATYSSLATYTIPVYGVPHPASITLSPRASTSGLASISPLSASDADGTIASFTFLSLPTSGTLYVNGVAVTSSNLTAAYPASNDQLTGLSFLPAPGSSGNVTFTYTATDNEGNRNTTGATYTIPVTANSNAAYPTGNTFSVHALKAGYTLVRPTDADGATVKATRTGAALPDFMTLQADGSISVNGDLIRVGTYATTITVTDAKGGISTNLPVVIEINADLYQANNDAVKTGENCYELTPNLPSKRGEVWRTAPIDLTKSFEITFSAYFGTNDGSGADGIAFALQRQAVNPLFAAGQTGEGLGVGHGEGTTRAGGISPSVVVEFDTYKNPLADNIEPAADHIAIFLNGEERAPVLPPVQMSSTSQNTEDGKSHTVRVSWDKDSKSLSVYFDWVLRTTYQADLQASVFAGDPMVYFGFTASTGSFSNQQSVCEIRYALTDHDGDGIADASDLDSDNDGISNLVESGNVNPFADHDTDGIPNYRDADFSPLNTKGVCASLDKDGDGYINALDLDSDNDGIPDAVEANGGNLPANMQLMGQYTLAFLQTDDLNGNGMADFWESSPLVNGNKDGDSLPNALDLDSDGDGILDAVEANGGKRPTGLGTLGRFPADYLVMNDLDQNGIVDTLAPNGDFDQDGLPNFLDLDSDNDGLSDWLEAQPEGGMVSARNIDTDLDGLDDAFGGTLEERGLKPIDSDGDGSPDFLDLDSDGDLVFDFIEALDTNKDGKSVDDFILLSAEFIKRAANTPSANYYSAQTKPNLMPAWMDYAADGRMNFLSPSNTAYYKDSDQDGLVDLMDEDSFGSEPSPSQVNYSFRSFSVVTPLPVTLIAFTAKAHRDGILLGWVTASEIDNASFEVERSADGKTFVLIGQVKGNGNSTVRLDYSFLDTKAQAGTVYYRLKQVDFNGKSEYSRTVAVQSIGVSEKSTIFLYPNPSSGAMRVVLGEQGYGVVKATIISMDGRTVQQSTLVDNVSHVVDVGGLPAGAYLMRLQGDNFSHVLRFIKE